jgi:hypothetical protein
VAGYVALLVLPTATSAVNPTIAPGLALLGSAGGDAAFGVNWGSWQAGVATVNGALTVGSAHFADTNNLTSATQLAALGPTLISANYSYVGGPAPTNQAGLTGAITSLNVGVNFATQNITSYSVAATGPLLTSWSASGSGTMANFSGASGIALAGTCTGCIPLLAQPASGAAHGQFVGPAAEKMITSFGLNSGIQAITGVGYLTR